MDDVSRGGLVLDVTDVGERPDDRDQPVVLCLHGFPQDGSAFDAVAAALAAHGVRVLVPDQRGYSPRARPAGRRPYALAELVADAVALLDAAGVRRAHVVGHDRVASLTALSQAHPAAMARAARRPDQARRSWYVAALQVPWLPERLLLRGGGRALRRTLVRTGLPPARADGYARRAAETGRLTAAVGWYRALPFARAVGPVDVPVTYLHGRRDPFYADAAVEGTATHVRGPYVRRTLETGHWVPETEPGAVVDAVLEHVAAATAGGGEGTA